MSLIGTPKSDQPEAVQGFEIMHSAEDLVIGEGSWSVMVVFGDTDTVQSVWLSLDDITPEQWQAMSNAMSSAGLRKLSQNTHMLEDAWVVDEVRTGAGVKAKVVFHSGATKASASISLESCGKCSA